jgi:hypothetical protein
MATAAILATVAAAMMAASMAAALAFAGDDVGSAGKDAHRQQRRYDHPLFGKCHFETPHVIGTI